MHYRFSQKSQILVKSSFGTQLQKPRSIFSNTAVIRDAKLVIQRCVLLTFSSQSKMIPSGEVADEVLLHTENYLLLTKLFITFPQIQAELGRSITDQ